MGAAAWMLDAAVGWYLGGFGTQPGMCGMRGGGIYHMSTSIGARGLPPRPSHLDLPPHRPASLVESCPRPDGARRRPPRLRRLPLCAALPAPTGCVWPVGPPTVRNTPAPPRGGCRSPVRVLAVDLRAHDEPAGRKGNMAGGKSLAERTNSTSRGVEKKNRSPTGTCLDFWTPKKGSHVEVGF